jgi:hypothetical protein
MRVQGGLDFENLPVALDSGQRRSGCLVGRIVPEDVIVRVNGGCDATDLLPASTSQAAPWARSLPRT